MDLELQSVLLIAAIIAIVAILVHGLFTIRQSNKPIDVSELNLSESDDDRDGSGFDCHGVGVARVIKTDTDDKLTTTPESQLSLNINHADIKVKNSSIDFDVALDTSKNNDEPSINTIADSDIDKTSVPMFASPIAKEKEDFLAVKIEEPVTPKIIETNIEEPDTQIPNVQELVEIDSVLDDENHNDEVTETRSNDVMDVLVLNVVGEDGDDLDGATLLPLLLTLGFKFGDMNIFHRHVDAAGQGAVLFSLANMVQPGHFDIDNMEQFSTKGVSLFMTIPHKQGNMETFNTMLNASAKIAEEFNGQVLDGDRKTLTNQSTQKYVQRIRQLDRKL